MLQFVHARNSPLFGSTKANYRSSVAVFFMRCELLNQTVTPLQLITITGTSLSLKVFYSTTTVHRYRVPSQSQVPVPGTLVLEE